MENCPFCGSEDIYYSKKRKVFVCEDCDNTFSEQQLFVGKNTTKDGGLNLFFSYGHDKNRILVERIKKDLEKRGHTVWIDIDEIKAGDHWRDDILNGVLNASSVIAFLSEHSTRKPGVCLDELKIAVCVKGANINTILLEPETRIKPPATLSGIQWLDMSSWYDIKMASNEAFEEWYKEKFAELCRVIESKDSIELNGDIHLLKTKLRPYLNSEKEYSLLSKEFYGRRWLEDYVEKWQNRKNAKALLLYGRPGSGKSAFSVNYSHYNSDVFGCFLCEWNRENTIDPLCLIRTIAFKLATKLPDYRSLLLHQLDADVSLDEMDAETLFDHLLGYPLSQLVDGNRETGIIVVDGLDEAENNGDNPLAEVFAKCVERLPRWIRFVFTSRPEKNVIQYFQGCEAIDIIDDMPEEYNDIMAYLVKSLATELNQIPNKLEMLNQICELSDGVFLYAELLVTDIKNGYVKISDVSTFPKGLNAYYLLSMGRKFSTPESFTQVKDVLEILSISDSVPEELVRKALGLSQYTMITCLDKLGSWVSRYEEYELCLLGFSHKSFKDWLTDYEKSGKYYVDNKVGAGKLAQYAREVLENESCEGGNLNHPFRTYLKLHIGEYFLLSEKYAELECFLCAHNTELDPYWRVWSHFPAGWNHSTLLASFWSSMLRNQFLHDLQREGNVSYLLWFFDIAERKYGIKGFDKELISIYIDIVHMSGEYDKAVYIADQYLEGNMEKITDDEFLAMLCVRRIHHSMFYKPVRTLLDDALSLCSQLDERFPIVYNELLFLIGGNLGVLYGDWDFCEKWLNRSIQFAKERDMTDFYMRSIRKMADFYCHLEDYEKAEILLKENITSDGMISGRYEAYLIGALANVYTCIGNDDEAIKCYEKLLNYTTSKGIVGWTAHAYLGMANINYKLGNINEAVVNSEKAKEIYKKIHQEWGLIMSETLLAACESRLGIAPMQVACDQALKHAKKMQYGSCVAVIEEFCSGPANYLKLYYL